MVETDNYVHNDGRPLELMSFTFCIEKFAQQKKEHHEFQKVKTNQFFKWKRQSAVSHLVGVLRYCKSTLYLVVQAVGSVNTAALW